MREYEKLATNTLSADTYIIPSFHICDEAYILRKPYAPEPGNTKFM